MLHVFHEQARQVRAGRGGPLGLSSPHMHGEAKRARQQTRSTKLYIHGRGSKRRARSCIHGRAAGADVRTSER